MTEIVRHSDAENLATAVADRFIDRLASVQASGRTPNVGLTGGTIANDIYRAVAASSHRSDVDWSS
ncbi:MAG TPA: 6-phosphogluconolactonase, partial [Nocardioidaceae bacterium]|nr:6-phosphogluconolactonase [Nocardioidaceae bacterium]